MSVDGFLVNSQEANLPWTWANRMYQATRPALRRIAAIHRALRAERYPSVELLAQELEVKRRTILRDIEFMRNSLHAPIGVSRARRGYYYRQPDFNLPFFQLTEGELVSLFVAERVLKQYRGTHFEADLSRAFRKIVDELGDEVSLNLAEIGDAHSFRLSAPSVHDVETFAKLAAAVRSRRQLHITYWTASRDEVTERTIDPLHLTNIDGDWFLLAWCHLRGRIQTFAPSRIRRLRETTQTFSPPDGFSPAAFLAHSFRVIQEERGPVHHVRLRFTPFAARFVAERTWHPSQKLSRLADGSVDLELQVTSLIEVRKWALGFGSDCEVLGPPEFRRQVAEESQKMFARYRAGSTDHQRPGVNGNTVESATLSTNSNAPNGSPRKRSLATMSNARRTKRPT